MNHIDVNLFGTLNSLQLFAVLFFIMLFVLGIGTLVAQANTLVAILCDHYKWMKASIVALITTICGFLSGIVYVTPVLMCVKQNEKQKKKKTKT